ncbi:Alpha/Beta hydrolase protein [Boeremia exigua]|uniref:Alpha/Beta hydrolase protein n=1 Tax=Boeremia exigua TaxID=749465 RepID=UPI001E8DB429|nr:Alpha/Beta hydrolase protein [Boeremia exigua]KAH6642243.1 Alpha/Beta hydrolase protein [Boeremia exigua]
MMLSSIGVAILTLGSFAVGSDNTTQSCAGVAAISSKCKSQQTHHQRDVFYVGGRLLNTGTGNLTVDQLYVEKLTPSVGVTQPRPLVFFHGGAVSGTTWLNTPDGRQGLAGFFLEQGYQVYLLDHTSVGRSSQMNTRDYVLWNTTTQEGVQSGFTAPELLATYPQAKLHTQWPGSGQIGDPFFDTFRKGIIPFTSNFTLAELSMRAAGCELLSLIGPSYLFSHSLGALYPILLSNDCPENVAGNINLEHSTQPFWNYGLTIDSGSATRPWGLTNTPLDYEPPVADPSELQQIIVGNDTLARRNCHLQAEPARKLPKIASVPYLCLTGEASVHATYDHCVIDFLEQAGGSPDWIKLAERNITGNGHFMHIEKNNMKIAMVIEDWIQGGTK